MAKPPTKGNPMTLQETTAAAKASANLKLKRKKRPKTPAERAAEQARRDAERARLAQYQNPNQVLTFQQWCLLNTLSKATGKRILDSGAGPIVTELGVRRVGITVGNNSTWQQSRSRG
jgi:hypothetical protein